MRAAREMVRDRGSAMVQSHDQSSLARRPSNLPISSRNLSTQEFEEVIRRAVELQADSSARVEEGLSEADVVRIGRELGLDPTTIRRAMAEVRGRLAKEKGLLVTLAGPRTVHASRMVEPPGGTGGSRPGASPAREGVHAGAAAVPGPHAFRPRFQLWRRSRPDLPADSLVLPTGPST